LPCSLAHVLSEYQMRMNSSMESLSVLSICSGYEDEENIGSLHGQAADNLPEFPRIDEIHPGSGDIVWVEERLEVGRALEKE